MHSLLAATGEPVVPTLADVFGHAPKAPLTPDEIQESNIAIRSYRADYLSYWASTASLTGTGRPVDAVIAPTTPYASPLVGKLRYSGYTTAFNLLDYSVCVVPVTRADKGIDRYGSGMFEALSEQDQVCYEECKFFAN